MTDTRVFRQRYTPESGTVPEHRRLPPAGLSERSGSTPMIRNFTNLLHRDRFRYTHQNSAFRLCPDSDFGAAASRCTLAGTGRTLLLARAVEERLLLQQPRLPGRPCNRAERMANPDPARLSIQTLRSVRFPGPPRRAVLDDPGEVPLSTLRSHPGGDRSSPG